MAPRGRLKLTPNALSAFPPRSASWNEEMEKRSRRRVRDLVARPAFQGLSENEIGRARISIMARNANVPFKGRIQKRKTYHLQIIISACNARPVHTVGSNSVIVEMSAA